MRKLVVAFLLMGMSLCVFAQNGVIKQVSGTVELKRAGETAYVPAKAGDTVSGNTVISTGLKSFAVIEIGSAVINVRPATRLTLTEIRALGNEESLKVDLRVGSVRMEVNPPAGTRASTTMQSPSATASVRGTAFFFDTRNLHVTQGTVLFKGTRGYTIQVSADSTTAVGWNGTPSAPESTTDYQDVTIAGYDPTAAATGGTGAIFNPTLGGPEAGGQGTGDVGVTY